MELTKILESLARIEEALKQPKSDDYESVETKDLIAALSKAQGEFPPIRYNRKSSDLSRAYSDFDNIMRNVAPILSKHGLAVDFHIKQSGNDANMLHGRLNHASGQWKESRCRAWAQKDDPLGFKSSLALLKGEMIMAMLGISSADNPFDDNGYFASLPRKTDEEKGFAPNLEYVQRRDNMELINDEQLEELNKELNGWPDIAEQVLAGLRINCLADMQKKDFHSSAKKIRTLILAREGYLK